MTERFTPNWVWCFSRHPAPVAVFGDRTKSNDDVTAITVGVPVDTYPKAGRDYSVRETILSGWVLPVEMTLEEAAAAEAANRLAANAAQAVRIRRQPGERFISADVDEPCFLARVADEAGTSRAWLLEYE